MRIAPAWFSARGYLSFSPAVRIVFDPESPAARSRCWQPTHAAGKVRPSMDDYALVLDAGSSSLKFCVFCRPGGAPWQLEERGQIDGIGTVARLSSKDGQGEVLAQNDLSSTVSDGRAAIDALAAWLRSRYGNARVLGVGHRVVHGGTKYDRPVLIARNVLVELYQLIPLAPLHQPYNLAAIER